MGYQLIKKLVKNKPNTNTYIPSNNVYLSVRDEKFKKIENNYENYDSVYNAPSTHKNGAKIVVGSEGTNYAAEIA